MFPASTLFRLTTPEAVGSVPDPEYWLNRCEGYRVDGPDGRIGTVVHVHHASAAGDGRLMLTTGLFCRRLVGVPFADVAEVRPWEERVVVSRFGDREPGGRAPRSARGSQLIRSGPGEPVLRRPTPKCVREADESNPTKEERRWQPASHDGHRSSRSNECRKTSNAYLVP